MSKSQRIFLILLCIVSALIAHTTSTGKLGYRNSGVYATIFGVSLGASSSGDPRFLGFVLDSTLAPQANGGFGFTTPTTTDRIAAATMGLLIPLGFIGSAIWLHLGGRHKDLIAKGICGHCGYNRSETDINQKCPECGRFQM